MKFRNYIVKNSRWVRLIKPKKYKIYQDSDIDIEKLNREFANKVLQNYYDEELDPLNSGGYSKKESLGNDWSDWFTRGYYTSKNQRIKHLEIFMRKNKLGVLKNVNRYKGY